MAVTIFWQLFFLECCSAFISGVLAVYCLFSTWWEYFFLARGDVTARGDYFFGNCYFLNVAQHSLVEFSWFIVVYCLFSTCWVAVTIFWQLLFLECCSAFISGVGVSSRGLLFVGALLHVLSTCCRICFSTCCTSYYSIGCAALLYFDQFRCL